MPRMPQWGLSGERSGACGTQRTWATRWFRPSLSWARLSLRALSLDKESRSEASSALSLVIDSSSSTRPASACRVRTRVARGGSDRRDGARRGETGKDVQRHGETRTDKEKGREMGRGGTVGRNQRHGEAGPSEMGQGDEGDTGSDKSVTAEALCHHRAGQGRAREQGSPRAGPRRGTAQGQDFRERGRRQRLCRQLSQTPGSTSRDGTERPELQTLPREQLAKQGTGPLEEVDSLMAGIAGHSGVRAKSQPESRRKGSARDQGQRSA